MRRARTSTGLIADATLEARCRDLVETVEIPDPFSLPALAEAVAKTAATTIAVRPLPADIPPELSGLVTDTDTGYLVAYPVDAEPWWALVCLAHELGHILCGHLVDEEESDGGAEAGTDPLEGVIEGFEEAKAKWGGRLWRRHMSHDLEREAELVATLLVERIEHAAATRAVDPDNDDDVVGRFAHVLGARRARRR